MAGKRLRLLIGVAVSLALGAVGIVLSAPPVLQSPGNWTQFRLNDANNAVLAGSMSASWRLQTGASYSSSPTLANGTLYIGDNAGVLRAIDPARGRVLWSATVAKPLMSAPLVYGYAVIVGEGDENSPSAATPSHPIHVGSSEAALLAYDRRTGALLWRVALPGSGMPTPAVIGGLLVHHDGAGYVFAVDPATGRVVYSRNIHSIASMSAALPLGGDRFITAGIDTNAVWMLSATNGAVIWRTTFSALGSGLGDCPPASGSGAIFCNYAMPPSAAVPIQTERDAVERAFALTPSGKRLWDVYLERGSLPKRNEAAIPLYANGLFFCGSSLAPYVHAFDPRTGRLVWRTRVRGAVLGGMAAVNNVLYLGDLSGYLWALDARTGAVLGDVYEGTAFNVASPLIAGQTLIIASRGGSVIAVPLRTIRDSRDG